MPVYVFIFVLYNLAHPTFNHLLPSFQMIAQEDNKGMLQGRRSGSFTVVFKSSLHKGRLYIRRQSFMDHTGTSGLFLCS